MNNNLLKDSVCRAFFSSAKQKSSCFVPCYSSSCTFLSRWCMSTIFHCVLVVPLGQICRSANHWADWVKDETWEFWPIPLCTKNKKLPDENWFIGCPMSCGASTQDLIFKIAKKHMSDSRLWRHDFWKGRSKVSLVSRVLFFQGLDKDFTTTLPLLQLSYIFCTVISCTFGVKPLTLPPGPRFRALSNPCLGGHRMLTWPGFAQCP